MNVFPASKAQKTLNHQNNFATIKLRHYLKEAEQRLNILFKRVDEVQVGAFHRATGASLTTWAIMEGRIVFIASLLLRADPEKVGLVFYSIVNFQVWIAIVTELFALEPDLSLCQRRWNKIAARLRAEKDFRDRLAHTPVVEDKDASTLETRRALVMGNVLDTRAKSQAFKPMTIEQVMDFRNRVSTIAEDLMELFEDARAQLLARQQATSPETPTEPPRDPTG